MGKGLGRRQFGSAGNRAEEIPGDAGKDGSHPGEEVDPVAYLEASAEPLAAGD